MKRKEITKTFYDYIKLKTTPLSLVYINNQRFKGFKAPSFHKKMFISNTNKLMFNQEKLFMMFGPNLAKYELFSPT